MAGPSDPAWASFPVPPPVANFPWVQTSGPGIGQLTPMALEFIQVLWASIQGGGGILDLLLAAFPEPGVTAAQILAYLDADPRLPAALGGLQGQLASLRAEIEAAALLALQVHPVPPVSSDVIWRLVASQDLVANTLVNVWNDGAAFHVRPADTTSAISGAQEAHGFIRQACLTGNAVPVVFSGILTGLSALTPGVAYLGASGAVTSTPNTTAGQISQQVGVAVAADTLIFQPQPSIGL